MRGIAPIDVAVVDEDLMWRVDHMNGIHGVYVKDYADLSDALDELTPGYPAVVVVGPGNVEGSLGSVAALRTDHPEVQVVFVVDPETEQGFRERATTSGVAALLERAEDDEPALAQVVLGLLPVEERRDIVELGGSAEAGGAGVGGLPTLPERLVVVTSAKGGEGVTTVAANLASALAGGGARRVALVEGDPNFGDLSMLLDLPAPARRDLDRLVVDSDTVSAFTVFHEQAGISVVRPPRYEGVYADLASGAVLDLLAALAGTADIVVVDAPLPLVVGANLAERASVVLLVSTQRTTSLKNAMLAGSALGRPRSLSLVVNDVGRHPNTPNRREVEHATNLRVVAEVPYDGRLDRAGSETAPHVLADPRSGPGRSVAELADRLLTGALLTVAG